MRQLPVVMFGEHIPDEFFLSAETGRIKAEAGAPG
jgi:hypothetical protein